MGSLYEVLQETATRLGMGLRIGVDGEVFAPWYVNISAGYNAFNLLGRNDSRGELFTPSNLSEKVESIIGAIATTILIQYKLRHPQKTSQVWMPHWPALGPLHPQPSMQNATSPS